MNLNHREFPWCLWRCLTRQHAVFPLSCSHGEERRKIGQVQTGCPIERHRRNSAYVVDSSSSVNTHEKSPDMKHSNKAYGTCNCGCAYRGEAARREEVSDTAEAIASRRWWSWAPGRLGRRQCSGRLFIVIQDRERDPPELAVESFDAQSDAVPSPQSWIALISVNAQRLSQSPPPLFGGLSACASQTTVLRTSSSCVDCRQRRPLLYSLQ